MNTLQIIQYIEICNSLNRVIHFNIYIYGSNMNCKLLNTINLI